VYALNDITYNYVGYVYLCVNAISFVTLQITEKYFVVEMKQTAEGISIIQNLESLPVLIFLSQVIYNEDPISSFSNLNGNFIVVAIASTSIFAFFINLCYMKISKFAEATSIAVAGNLNKILSILLSTYFFEERLTSYQVLGLVISLVGIGLYVTKGGKERIFECITPMRIFKISLMILMAYSVSCLPNDLKNGIE
jgi:drug/metabolite transporter (DMT)-like permease